jgi:hypothetical protein
MRSNEPIAAHSCFKQTRWLAFEHPMPYARIQKQAPVYCSVHTNSALIHIP